MKSLVSTLFTLASVVSVSAFSHSPLTTRIISQAHTGVSKTKKILGQTSIVSTQKTSLFTSSTDEGGFFSDIQINPPYALAYVGFLAFAAYMTTLEAPGASQVILDKFLSDPVNPGVNELFASIFNLLGLAAIPIACISMPGAKGQKPALVPFLLGGVFAGYGSIGTKFLSIRCCICTYATDLIHFCS
jgi:hypothetical protein